MAKKKERNELEHLRSENRKMKSVIRHLKKVSQANEKKMRGYDQFVGEPEPEITEENFQQFKPRCPECGNANLDIVDLVLRELHTCDDCGYRKVFQKKKA